MAPAEKTPTLDAGQLRSALPGALIGREVVVLEQTTSTNDEIWKHGQAGAEQGLVVFAEHQTAGRGQHGNSWESSAGKGLWFSILLHPNLPLEESPRLTDWAAGAVAETLKSHLSVPATVKLPNDIYIGDKKIAGVLVEMRAVPQSAHLAVLGIGINVNQAAADFSEAVRPRAASLSMLLKRTLDRQALAIALLENLDRTYRRQF